MSFVCHLPFTAIAEAVHERLAPLSDRLPSFNHLPEDQEPPFLFVGGLNLSSDESTKDSGIFQVEQPMSVWTSTEGYLDGYELAGEIALRLTQASLDLTPHGFRLWQPTYCKTGRTRRVFDAGTWFQAIDLQFFFCVEDLKPNN